MMTTFADGLAAAIRCACSDGGMRVSSDPKSSLTLYDAVSTHRTLQIMFWVVIVLLPIVIAYTSWAYRIMRGTVTERAVRESGHY